jgi:hypothetical protein
MSLPAVSRPNRLLGIFIVFLIAILLISCSTQRVEGPQGGPAGGDEGGGEGNGADDDDVDSSDSEESEDDDTDSSDSEESGEEEFEGFDFTSYFDCPDEPYRFALFVDFSLYAEDDEGFYTQRTHNEGDVNINYAVLNISKQGVDQVYDTIVPIVIEGESGDCFVTGDGAIRLTVSGTCSGQKAHIEVLGTYESWSQTIKCPGEAPVTASDSAYPAPSLDGDFWLTTAGDTISEGMNFEQLKFAYRWTLKAYEKGDEPMEPLVPLTK